MFPMEVPMKASAVTLALLLFTLTFLSCVDNGSETPAIIAAREEGRINLAFSTPPEEIAVVRARITRPGFSVQEIQMSISDSGAGASGRFTSVVAGLWHLRVDALDAGGIVRFTGETDVEVRSGTTAHVSLQLLPSSGSIEIVVTWGPVSPPQAGLMAYFRLDGDALDASGNNNHGMISGAVPTSDRRGEPGRALWFDGINDLVDIPSSPSLHPNQHLTIAFWMRVDSLTGMYSPILHKGGDVTPTSYNREYAVYIMGPHPAYHVEVYAGMHWTGSLRYPVGRWIFVTGIVDKNAHTIRCYVDGIFQSVDNDPNTSFFTNDFSLLIGAERETTWPDHAPFRGAIDDLRLYNRALTAAEILALYLE
jgi:hypothetical protein